ncbi:MAG: Do family serine endopeptidase [Betaproteobacteria bacterium]|nr:Do family serine endopeptidase [Betaproteobacteria bacterium]
MRRLWLIFAQTTTVCLGILFVVSTLRPDLLSWRARTNVEVVTTREAAVETPLRRMTSFSDAATKAMPTVVNIYTSKEINLPRHPFMDDPVFRHFFGDQFNAQKRRSSSLGSGVLVSDRGYILTNHHVVEAADEIEVALADTRRAKASLIGTDPETDLAVLRIDLKKLPVATFAQSDQARIGDVVLAIGNPFGVGQTVTLGIISALSRSQLGINTFENFIQTDAAINPGNSGGALVDSAGNLLGINTAIYSRSGGSQGIGFAIPSSLAKQVMEQIIATGAVTRGWVGIGVQDMTPELAKALNLPKVNGALITDVVPRSPAQQAGLRAGDVLVAVNNKPVTDYASTLNLIAALKPGTVAPLKVVRANEEIEFKVNVGTRPKPARSDK